MQFLLNLWQRIRAFNFRELSTTQIVVGVTGLIVVLWLIAQLLSFIAGLLNIVAPIAIIAMIAYFGYSFLRSRSEDIPDAARKSQRERDVEDAVAAYQANLDNLDPVVDIDNAATVAVIDADTLEQSTETSDSDSDDLAIKQIVNPETGFKEPDISRLIEHEEQKLKEATQVNDDIMAQIEARRKRLQNQANDQ